MALSKIDVCNHALLKVGADLIASLDTSSATDEGVIRSATLCNVFYDQALEETLRLYPWNCCTKRATPTKLATAPAFGYDNAFQIPNDCMRIINIFDNVNQYDGEMRWTIEGDHILCDYSTIYLKYIAKPTSVGILDPLAMQAFICVLASKLCSPLQLDSDWAMRITNELYQIVLPQARSIDTIENKELMLEESYWITGRNFDRPTI